MIYTDGMINIVSIGFKALSFSKIKNILNEEAGNGGDLFMLPEFCLGKDIIIHEDGMEIAEISFIARKNSIYVLFPVFSYGENGERFNTAYLFDRSGAIILKYNKAFPFWNEFNLSPPTAAGSSIEVVNTEFGRIGIAICFDANFPAVWEKLSLQNARLVLFTSAYSAGKSIMAHAINYNYNIVSCTGVPDCVFYDLTGEELYYQKSEEDAINISRVSVDMNRCVFHQNYNMSKCDRMLSENRDVVEKDAEFPREQWFTIKAGKAGVNVKALTEKYDMETLQDYKKRSRIAIDEKRGFKY